MIQANELRIGNYILYQPIANEEGSIQKVCGIIGGFTLGRILFNTNNNEGALLHFVKPISLTPEILEKCGFIEDEIVTEDEEITFYNDCKLNLDSNFQPTDAGFHIAKYEIKYVHQLQNLYFALIGEELSINI